MVASGFARKGSIPLFKLFLRSDSAIVIRWKQKGTIKITLLLNQFFDSLLKVVAGKIDCGNVSLCV